MDSQEKKGRPAQHGTDGLSAKHFELRQSVNSICILLPFPRSVPTPQEIVFISCYIAIFCLVAIDISKHTWDKLAFRLDPTDPPKAWQLACRYDHFASCFLRCCSNWGWGPRRDRQNCGRNSSSPLTAFAGGEISNSRLESRQLRGSQLDCLGYEKKGLRWVNVKYNLKIYYFSKKT